MKIKGVDLSYCQEGISFPALKQAGVKFAIIRAGFSTKKDVTMDRFVADCKKYSIAYGFYWYSYAMSVKQAQAEAEKCVDVIKGLSPTYPVFFDMEEKKQIDGLNTDTRTNCVLRKDKESRIQARNLRKSVLYGELLRQEQNCRQVRHLACPLDEQPRTTVKVRLRSDHVAVGA